MFPFLSFLGPWSGKEILGGSVPSCSPNPDPISDQTISFFTPVFQTRPLKSFLFFRPEILSRLLRIIMGMRAQTKNFFKCTLNSHISMFFLSHLKLKGSICPYAPVVPSKTILDSRPKWAKPIPVFRPKRPKNPTLGVGT